jgi:uncharacterized protein (TIGR04255 family)
MADGLPKKLKYDAIVDAVFEARFDSPAGVLPEIIFGRLADVTAWKEFQQVRLPTADIPAALRRSDPELRYQPSFSLIDKKTNVHVRVGPNVLLYSRLPPYPGWEVFGAEINLAIDELFKAVPAITVTRLGFRYINALRSDVHGVDCSEQLKISLNVADHRLTDSFNLAYVNQAFEGSNVTVRVATVDQIQGSPPENTKMVVDIDVGTKDGFKTTEAAEIKNWVDRAHQSEKAQFFGLLNDNIIAKLKDE